MSTPPNPDKQKQFLTLWWLKRTFIRKNPWLASLILRQIQHLRRTQKWLKAGSYVLWNKSQTKIKMVRQELRLPRPSKQLLISTITGTTLLLATVSPALAGTITVNSTADNITVDGQCTLREAIAVANNNSDTADCPIVGAPGDDTIDMTTISGTINLGSDLPVITENLQLNGPGAAPLTLDGNGYDAIFGSPGANNMGVDGLTITNVSGDGVYAYNDATVTNSVITGTASGVYAYYGNATVTNSTITGQTGDGVYAYYDATVTNSSVISGSGHGIFALGNAIVSDSQVTGSNYNGIYGYNTAITDTVVSGGGCGVFAYPGGASINNSQVMAEGCHGVFGFTKATVTNNSVITGNIHGVYVITGTASISDSTVTANTAVGVLALQNSGPISMTGVSSNTVGAIMAQDDLAITRSTVSGSGNLGSLAVNQTTISNSTVTGTVGVVSYKSVMVSSSTVTGAIGDGVDSFSNVIVSDSTIRGGQYGVYSYTGYASVNSSMVTGDNDDGVSAYTNATVTDSTITGGDDGVDANRGDASVSNSLVSGADDGIDARYSITVTNSSVITGAEYGVYARLGSATVNNSTVTGGGAFAGVLADIQATVAYSTITGGDSGSGVVVTNTATISNSTISGSGQHGVVNLTSNAVTINHSTIANNTGYGIFNDGGTTVVNNSIIANNGGLGTTRDIDGVIDSGTYNLIGNGDGSGLTNGDKGNLLGSTGALLDAQLGPLQNNGGSTATHLPALTSPAVDAGDPAFSGPPTFDQRGSGFARVLGTLDIGAVEQEGAAASNLIYMPIIFKDASFVPDLVITNITATSSDIQVTIQNQGNAAVTDAFWIDVYYDLGSAPVINQQGPLYWGLSVPNGGIPIAAGESITLSLASPYYFEGSLPNSGAEVYGYVDAIDHATTYGAVQESNEGNNVFGPVTATGGSATSAPIPSNSPTNQNGLPLRVVVEISPASSLIEQERQIRRQNRDQEQNDNRRGNGWSALPQIENFSEYQPNRDWRQGRGQGRNANN